MRTMFDYTKTIFATTLVAFAFVTPVMAGGPTVTTNVPTVEAARGTAAADTDPVMTAINKRNRAFEFYLRATFNISNTETLLAEAKARVMDAVTTTGDAGLMYIFNDGATDNYLNAFEIASPGFIALWKSVPEAKAELAEAVAVFEQAETELAEARDELQDAALTEAETVLAALPFGQVDDLLASMMVKQVEAKIAEAELREQLAEVKEALELIQAEAAASCTNNNGSLLVCSKPGHQVATAAIKDE